MNSGVGRILTTLSLALAPVACGEVPVLEELSPDRTCRRTIQVGPAGVPEDGLASPEPWREARTAEVEWLGPRSPDQRHQLNAWCAAVGPAVFGGWADPPAGVVDSIAIVSWNVHVGGGDLRRLVRDLREGVLTEGRPVRHFALLLQEAYREDDTVPSFQSGLPLGSGVTVAPPSGSRVDIVASARELGLSIFYAPSMRNGEGIRDEDPEDRGNAILATVPLADPVAIELPVARQRRVAVAARLLAADAEGEPAPFLHVSSVHLENDASGWARDEAARLAQAEALVDALPDDDAAVSAGDFNTWTRGQDEALVRVMLRAFPETPPFPQGHTYTRGYGLVRRYLDYIFVRLPEGGRATVLRVPDPYASDHFPIVGWLTLPAGPGGP